MTRTRNRFRRLAAVAAVSALPLAGAGALITAQPASAQFFFPTSPFTTTGFAPGGINFHPDNSTTDVTNFGDNNATVIDNGLGSDWPWGGWQPPWWDNGWDWTPGWNGWGGPGWNGFGSGLGGWF